MNGNRILLLCAGGLLGFASLKAAGEVKVSASIDSTSILVGQQTKIRLEVAQDKGQTVMHPMWTDTLVTGVEILEVGRPDTTALSDSRIQVEQELLVTSFDSGFYYIPPFRYVSRSDTFETSSLSLKVVPFEVDTTAAEFDIKTVMAPPFVWKDYAYLLLLALLIPLLIVAGIYIYRRIKNKKPLIGNVKEEPLLPADVRALNALETIKQRKLWQNNREKEYYTEITDVLRQYIQERFRIPAMEMTSGEILSHIRTSHEAQSVYENLKQILGTADFVKFAKLRPLADENELSMMNAMLFVNQTREEIPVEEAEDREEASEDKNPEKDGENKIG